MAITTKIPTTLLRHGNPQTVCELPVTNWQETSIADARLRIKTKEPLLVYYAESWKVPSGASGWDDCWAYFDRLGMASNANWSSSATSTLFGQAGHSGFTFYKPHITE